MSRTASHQVLERLSRLPPDALRAILAEWDRARLRRGGDIHVIIRETVVIPTEYERRGGAA